ncbi:hypothetical protein Tco_0195956, partial [Tanacetum coccineum]
MEVPTLMMARKVHRSANSIKVIKEALNEFNKTSGLHPNMSKSTIFFGNMNNIEKYNLIEILPFRTGVLMKYLGVPLITKRNAARWENNMIVADMIQDGRWQWLNGWSQIFDVPVLQECVKDKILWKIQNGKLFIFSAKTTWEDLRCRGQNVKWNNMVWYSQGFPRQPFILWLAVKEKLHTPDDDVEFKQEYVNLDNELRNIVEKLDNMPCTNNIRSVVRKFVLSTCVYFIWRERNARLFTNEKKNVKGLIKEIEENMKIQLMNIK